MPATSRTPLVLLSLGLAIPGCASAPVADRDLDRGASAPPPAAMARAIFDEALPEVAKASSLGLAQEARAMTSWITSRSDGGRSPLFLVDSHLQTSTGERLPVSPAMAAALRQFNDWYGLTQQKLARPITHEELRQAALAPASVARVSDLFEDCIRRGIVVDGSWIFPEIGGEATIDDELRLHPMPDPTWPTVQELVRRAPDVERVAALWRERESDLRLLDPHGLLKSALTRPTGGGSDVAAEVRRAAFTIARNAAEAYSLAPEKQFALILQTVWRGRYVGLWHTHSPHLTEAGWRGADVPSFEDMQNAVTHGQFLTLSFQPEGFDLYDAASLAEKARVDLSLLKVIRFRSEGWRDRFARLVPHRDNPLR